MKSANGTHYRREKTSMGRRYWVRMEPAEVAERRLYWVTVTMMPLACLLLFSWAAGLLG